MGPRTSRLIRAALIGAALLVALAHASGVWPLRLVEWLQLALDDTRLRATLLGTRDERIVIVDIDERSLAEIGRWPWGRDRIAALADELFVRQKVAGRRLRHGVLGARSERGTRVARTPRGA